MAQFPSQASASGLWSLKKQKRAEQGDNWPLIAVPGQQAYTTAGTYTWVAPAGVTSVSVVCVGGSGMGANIGAALNGGGGGALAYANNISVTPGSSYTVIVGAGAPSANTNGGNSSFNGTSCRAQGGQASTGGVVLNGTGGAGGTGGIGIPGSNNGGGGGAGGYAGAGGNGWSNSTAGTSGSGGGGAGGGNDYGAGGVGILGQGSSGIYTGANGGGGSGGQNGFTSGRGGDYGGGPAGFTGTGGAVRIIWPGTTRAFPSTQTGDL